MAGDPTGGLRLKAGDKEYRLHMGTSVLAALQGIHGQDVLAKFEAPAGAAAGWMPDMMILHDLFRLSLERHHGEIDRWEIDDLIAENMDALGQLMAAAMPDPGPDPGNAKPSRKKGRSTSGN